MAGQQPLAWAVSEHYSPVKVITGLICSVSLLSWLTFVYNSSYISLSGGGLEIAFLGFDEEADGGRNDC